jgi:hypothetical protein
MKESRGVVVVSEVESQRGCLLFKGVSGVAKETSAKLPGLDDISIV